MFTRGHGCYHPVIRTNSFHRSGSFRCTLSLCRTVRIASNLETKSFVKIFQIGDRELKVASWRLKEKGYVARSPPEGAGPRLYTFMSDRWSSIGTVSPAAALGPSTEALFCESPLPLVANRWISQRGVSTERLLTLTLGL